MNTEFTDIVSHLRNVFYIVIPQVNLNQPNVLYSFPFKSQVPL